MIVTRVCPCLLFFVLLDLATQIQPSLHGHNNAFVQDDKDVQYLLDNIPISMHKGFASSVHGTGQLGVPHQEIVTLFNKDDNKTIHLSSISGSTQHFHSSFFQDKVIPPLGNTTFNVVFLGRDEGEIDSHLFMHTSEGTVKYQVRGISVSSPYRLRPLVGVKLPINASFTPLIYMHNPHPEAMQVAEVYSSGGEFQLELPTGEAEGPRELWEIPPYQTKPVIRLHFNAHAEKNYTAYIRFKVNNSVEVLVVAVEVEVTSVAGLHWGGNSGVVNFGMGGSLQTPIHYHISLKNSAKKPVKVLNIISTPVSKALKINFEPVVIPGDTDVPIAVGTLAYDWKSGLDLQHFKGKLMIKGIGPGGSSQKLAIPWIAEVLQGGLQVNASVAHYCSPHSSQPRNFSVVNKFKRPLAITDVSLSSEAMPLFKINNFIPKILQPGQKETIFSLLLTQNKKSENLQLESSILIHSNVSTTEVPLLSYNGKLRKIIPGEKYSDKGTMNFGTVGSGTENEGIFALENQNPVNIELHGWGVNMPGAVLELMGCQHSPTGLFNKGYRNITACSITGNQSIKPGYLAIFKIKVKTPSVEEDTIFGDVFVRTTYERLTVPVFMRVAHGRISLKKLTFTDCFPGSVCTQQLKVHSTFSRPMEVTIVAPVQTDNRVKYIPLEETRVPVIWKGENHIGSIKIDTAVSCKQQCYLGLSLNTTVGSQWLNTVSLPSHTRDSDLNLLNTHYTRYLNYTGGNWDNVTMQLDTTEVRGHKFYLNIKPYWPSLLVNFSSLKNKSLSFPLTQVGNTSYKTIKLHNPSSSPLLLHLVMDWSYPQGSRLYHSLPNKFKPVCLDCPATMPGEFKIEALQSERDLFEKEWSITTAPQTLPLLLQPNETRDVQVSYTPPSDCLSAGLLYIRNNITILEVMRLVGRGAFAQFKFGNRKPGSATPLLFELAEKHLKDCERDRSRRNPIPNLTVKRSFTARNTGEVPIEIFGFYISGVSCEGYGFKVLNCEPFKLGPNDTKKIEIAYTPDFTLSRIERELLIITSLGGGEVPDVYENGIVRLSLLTTVPSRRLESCAEVLARPTWESALQWSAVSLLFVLLACVLAISFLEADRILRGVLVTLTRGNPVQPPLDLRLLSHSTHSQVNTKERSAYEERHKNGKKEDVSLDWSINGKKLKDKDSKSPKISDWSLEDERRFKLDIESKENSHSRRYEDFSPVDGNFSVTIGVRRKNVKRHNAGEMQEYSNENSPDVQDKKSEANCLIKSSPLTSRKGKSKEESQINDHEVQVESVTTFSKENTRSESRKKQAVNSNIPNNNTNCVQSHSYKKYESNTSPKSTQFSEEETSSTTTESSNHEDNSNFKNCDHTSKAEKSQRKPTTKKPKPQTIPSSLPVDYRDNYEGDCDDDDYDKEKQDNPYRWKMSTTRSSMKNHHHQSRYNVEAALKVTRQSKNTPRKEKPLQKRRNVEKTHAKTILFSGGLGQRDESKIPQSTISSPLPPPPACWGENRAKFSDVVARSQEATFSTLGNSRKSNSFGSHLNFENSSADKTKIQIEELSRSEFNFDLKTNLGVKDEKEKSFSSESARCHLDSYFINTFTEPSYEPELVPYDDLPETDEPLLELESVEEDSRCNLWDDSCSVLRLIPESAPVFKMESSNSEKITNLSDALTDNWATVETNWEPLYTRGAVGEERSGVWGVNTGGVWAAAPWGSPTPPMSSLSSCTTTKPKETDVSERPGFDPFRSLNTIWTPSSSETWKLKQEE
ncbi:transmembrane protein 131 isoform X2 [Belonocnema kinseyi]|uniref:transmembrane protein 131 isoform X2 n=1 Tax=Belonocnema kinseyi TaxID=2817044 RepID=UPI00143E068E|nr:transmembrane protein 131 isoform X2 [Belonocnema kinseyi]